MAFRWQEVDFPQRRPHHEATHAWGFFVRRLFRLWRLGAQDLRLLMTALRRPDKPWWLVPASIFLVWFALEPVNFAIPLLGVIDDFVLLPLLLRAIVIFAGRAIDGNAALRARDERVVSVQ